MLRLLSMWQEKNDSLYRKFIFKDFTEAFNFMKKVAELAEKQKHHPKWQNTWNTVEMWLSTHENGGITNKDHKLAKAIDKIIQPEAKKNIELEVKLFADGGSRGNPGPSASGYVILGPNDRVLAREGVYLGISTNNQAEYTSIKLGLEKAFKLGIKKLNVFMDSELVVKQLNGQYKVKHNDLKPLYLAVVEIANKFEQITFSHVPRELNTLADAEVNKALDKEQ